MNGINSRNDIILVVAEMISKELKIGLDDATDLFFKSDAYRALEDDGSGLCEELPGSTYRLFMNEYKEKRSIFY